MKKLRKISLIITMVGLTVFSVGQAFATQIYAIDYGVSGHAQVISAISQLRSLGNIVITGGRLYDYTSYDQVWDLRYSRNLDLIDLEAMASYLSFGGRMYLSGEHSGFDAIRNATLTNLINSLGGGNIVLDGNVSQREFFTSEGNKLLNNNPNQFPSISFTAARKISSVGNGFLVTETAASSGAGSLVGWDFGDIIGAPDARMLVGFDSQIFQNGQNWTENMVTFLGTPSPVPVPEPSTIFLLGVGLAGICLVRRLTKS